MSATLNRDALWNKNSWLVGSKWNRLHYIPGIDSNTWRVWWDANVTPSYHHSELRAACGQTIHADLPGIFARMGCPRCTRCCRAVGIPPGDGAALNDHSLDALRDANPLPEETNP